MEEKTKLTIHMVDFELPYNEKKLKDYYQNKQ